ncbi:GntR family transcriptional regulator [Planococcus sp. ISL-109]|uniref:GntR family transcriptional regulator n=1 Tax=Planococcus sp. ISL-109 TaxID=2819166 RepID=UPI001BED1384|nr:GntR family transcriptional regulator [Planococcus sp. ISL-109]MBT2582827.1 GntR family transcriptional regulator [Planococcus sp. ISL-109]
MKPDLMKNSLPNLIAEDITKQIMMGTLKTGEKLVEHIYAEEYGTSRAPVREAIYLLAVKGLVERIPRKGAIVKEYKKSEILDLLEIRNMFENMSMDRIIQHGPNPDLLEKMEQIMEQMKKAEDVYSYTQLNYAFHTCLIKMSKSETIIEMYSRLGLPLLKIQSISFAHEGNIEKSIIEHQFIIKLLREKNLVELSVVLSKHNRDVVSNFQKSLQV